MRNFYMKVLSTLLAVFCLANVSAQTITINYEQEGNGSPQLNYYSTGFVNTYVDLQVGENVIPDVKYMTDKIGNEWIPCFKLIFIPNPAGKLEEIYINGIPDSQAMSDYEVSGSFIYIIEEKADYEFSLKFVYDGAEAEVFTHNIIGNFTGEGTVQCDYVDTEGQQQSVELQAGENKINVMQESDGSYRMRVTPNPGEGLECTYLVADGYDEYALLDEYEQQGYADLVFYEGGNVVKNLYVRFEEPEEYDINVTYSVYGSGSTDYSYVSETTGSEVTGSFRLGENVFEDIKFDEVYALTVIPQPADNYAVTRVMIDGVENAEALASIEESGSFTLTSAEGRDDYELEMVYEPSEPIVVETHDVTLKANGYMIWQFKYSNVAEQRQDVFTIYERDTVVTLPDNAFCSWNYSASTDYVVRGLLVNGEPYDLPYIYIDKDMEIGLDLVANEYFEVNVETPAGGEIYVDYANFSLEIGDYEWVPLTEGQTVVSGTDIRLTIYAYDYYALKDIYVNGQSVKSFTVQEDVYEYTYEMTVWEDVEIKCDFYTLSSVNDVAADPVEMNVFAIDGRLVKKCMATSAKEATQGLPSGIYIVNGEKVVVDNAY